MPVRRPAWFYSSLAQSAVRSQSDGNRHVPPSLRGSGHTYLGYAYRMGQYFGEFVLIVANSIAKNKAEKSG